jgi:hypothetical protein
MPCSFVIFTEKFQCSEHSLEVFLCWIVLEAVDLDIKVQTENGGSWIGGDFLIGEKLDSAVDGFFGFFKSWLIRDDEFASSKRF